MLSTKEVMRFLTEKYNLEIDQSLLFKYAKKGLVTKEQKIGQGYKKGIQTFWENSAVGKVYIIKALLKQNFKLAEISKYHQMSKQEYLILDELELAKYNRVTKYFSEAESKISIG
ncbi:MAG: hypothetical protein L0956_09150 [Candidatus Mariimomonas ferrooxydans]